MTTDLAVARSDTGRVRDRNEDRWLARRHAGTVLLAVADGVGGTSGGDVASGLTVDTLDAAFAAAASRANPRSTLADAIQRANEVVLRRSAELGHPQAASTLVAVAIRGREACVANIGDSRAYLIRRGTPRQITTDHAGVPAGSITRFLGDARGVQPDIFVETLRPGDCLVLCSDGLTRHVSDAEIARRASTGDPARAADDLVGMANARGGLDNVTVVIYPARRRGVGRASIGTAILVALLAVGVAGALAAAIIGTSPGLPPPCPCPGRVAEPERRGLSRPGESGAEPDPERALVSRPGSRVYLHRPGTADAGVACVRALGHASADALPRVLLGSLASASRAADLHTTSGTRH